MHQHHCTKKACRFSIVSLNPNPPPRCKDCGSHSFLTDVGKGFGYTNHRKRNDRNSTVAIRRAPDNG